MQEMTVRTGSKFQLSLDDPKGLETFLIENDYLKTGEKLERLEKAGEGNMNKVLRAITNQRSFVLKQSLPWVNKFPSVAAPVSRIEMEHSFYQRVRKNDVLKHFTPEIYCFDKANHILCLEDLGAASDFTSIYKKGVSVSKSEMADIARVVSELHYSSKDDNADLAVDNMEMRKLNHQHIFQLPLQSNNGFELDGVLPGLQLNTDKFRSDKRLQTVAEELGQIYLSNKGGRLLHGDYYPGSWLNTEKGFRMIDPEFCFTGTPEFELGVVVAHLKMTQQPDSLIKDLFVYYHFDSNFDGQLFTKFAGMEIIRRLIGLAQLPLDLTLKERLDLLENARVWVTG